VIADNILSGKGFSLSRFTTEPVPTAFMPPFYTYYVTFFYLIGKNPIGYFMLEFVQGIFSALNAVLIMAIGRKLFGSIVGVLAGLIFCFYPSFIYMPTTVTNATFSVFLLACVIYYCLDLGEKSRRWCFVWVGVLLGISALNEPVSLILVPIVIIYLFKLLTIYRYEFIKSLALLLAAFFIIIAPWTIRNMVVLGRFVPIRSNGGWNLWIGHNPNASGSDKILLKDTYSIEDVKTEKDFRAKNIAGVHPFDYASEDLKRKVAGLSDTEADRIFLKEALEYIKAHPKETFVITLKKLRMFWWFDPNHSKAQHPLYRIPYFILLPLGIIGFVISKRKKELLIIYLCFIGYTLIYSLTLVAPRYRMPLEQFLMVFASLVIIRVLSALVKHRVPCYNII